MPDAQTLQQGADDEADEERHGVPAEETEDAAREVCDVATEEARHVAEGPCFDHGVKEDGAWS